VLLTAIAGAVDEPRAFVRLVGLLATTT